MTPRAFCYTHRSVSHSSEKLSPVVDGNEYKDPRLNDVQRVRDLKQHAVPEEMSSSNKPLPSGLRDYEGEEVERLQEPEGMEETPKKEGLLNTAEWGYI